MRKVYSFKFLFFLLLPVFAVFFWYAPSLFKGYSPMSMTEQIIFGKNIAESGMYAIDNDLNVFLSSSELEERGQESFMGNKLTGYLYAGVFKLFGVLSWNQLILFSAILNAVTLLVFTFLIFYLFNFRTAFVFSLVYIFLPFNGWRVYHLGIYEFALLFLSLFFLFYFLGREKKYNCLFFVFSGIFLSLAGLAREALFLIAPSVLLYLFFMHKKREILFIFTSFFIVLSVFYIPGILSGQNGYLQLFPGERSEELESRDFLFYGEFYPDPYTYHFDKQNFLDERLARKNEQSYITSLYNQKLAVNSNVSSMRFFDRMNLSFLLFFGHLAKFISLEDVGGPFVFLLMVLGFYFLHKNKSEISKFFIFVIGGVIISLVFLLAGRNHLTDFNWMIALLVSLGILFLFSVFKKYFELASRKKEFFLGIVIFSAVFYNFVLSSHVYWGRAYDNKDNLLVQAYNFEIKKMNIPNEEVIAIGSIGFLNALSLNYLSDKSVVVFHPQTVDKLLKNGKIILAFQDFNVKYIVGYPPILSEKIVQATSVKNISSSDIDTAVGNVSGAKSWLMNLVK